MVENTINSRWKWRFECLEGHTALEIKKKKDTSQSWFSDDYRFYCFTCNSYYYTAKDKKKMMYVTADQFAEEYR